MAIGCMLEKEHQIAKQEHDQIVEVVVVLRASVAVLGNLVLLVEVRTG